MDIKFEGKLVEAGDQKVYQVEATKGDSTVMFIIPADYVADYKDLKLEGKVIEISDHKLYEVEAIKGDRKLTFLVPANDIQSKRPELLMEIVLNYMKAKEQEDVKSIENPQELANAVKKATTSQVQISFEAFMEKISQAKNQFHLRNIYRKYQTSLSTYTPEQVSEIKKMITDKAKDFGINASEILGETPSKEKEKVNAKPIEKPIENSKESTMVADKGQKRKDLPKEKVDVNSIETPKEVAKAVKNTTTSQSQIPFETFMEKISRVKDQFHLRNTYKKYQASLNTYTLEQVAKIKNAVVDKARDFGIYGSEIIGEMTLREMKQRLNEVKTGEEMKEYMGLFKSVAAKLERENQAEYKALTSAVIQKQKQFSQSHQIER